jgi:hypothetical protein
MKKRQCYVVTYIFKVYIISIDACKNWFCNIERVNNWYQNQASITGPPPPPRQFQLPPPPPPS